jgi:hypothetical protein
MTDSGWRDPIFAADKNYQQTELPPIRLFKFPHPACSARWGARCTGATSRGPT